MLKFKTAVSSIGRVVNHCPPLRWIDRVARKLGIVRFLHMMQSKLNEGTNEEGAAFQAFYEQHKDEIQQVLGMLEDERSRHTLESVLKYRMTRKLSALNGVVAQPQYFQKDIYGPVEDEVFVDGGAYVGDTVENFVKNFAGGGGTNVYMLGSLIRPI